MREFLILAHDVEITPDVPLADLPGAGGRLDVLCRCVTAGLLRSHGIRSDTRVTIVIRDELTVTFDGDGIRHLQPDERSTAARFGEAFDAAADAVGHHPVEATPGLTVSRRDLPRVLADRAEASAAVFRLTDDGDPLTTQTPPTDAVFVLSDHQPLAAAERDVIDEHADATISLGPVALHGDQAITVAHNYLDTDGYQTY